MLKRVLKNKNSGSETEPKARTPLQARTVVKLVLIVLVTAVIFAVYRCLLNFDYFEFVLIGYMVVTTVLILIYLIYNRGMSRRGVTEEMLPDAWSTEQKRAFIEDGERRFQRSKWLLIPIIAFLFTFFYDVIELLILPCIQNFFVW